MSTKPEFVVFYAWQSDRPGSHNRYLIQEAAAIAAEILNQDTNSPFEIQIDQDTKGVPGLCDIPATILEKIDRADALLCDLTYVAESLADDDSDEEFQSRFCSNPNVLFELGYAFKTLGPERVICVMNESYGPVENQIFDLAHRRYPLTYRFPDPEKKATRAHVKAALGKHLVEAISALFPLGRRSDIADGNRATTIRSEFESQVKSGTFNELVRRRGAITISIIPATGTQLSHEVMQHQYIPPPGSSGFNNAIRGNAVLSINETENRIDKTIERSSVAELRVDGTILGADAWILDPAYHPQQSGLFVPSTATESAIINTVLKYMEALNKLNVPLPWTIGVSLLEIKGHFMFVSNEQSRWTKFSNDDIRTEPIGVRMIDQPLDRQFVAKLLRPAIDFIWREFGFDGSPNYTHDGIYNSRY